jgi:hypothetical protein
MRLVTMHFIAAIAVVLLPAIAAACPRGYVPCGQTNQLCCPEKP